MQRFFFIFLILLISCSRKEGGENRLKISFNMQPATTDPRLAGDFVSSTLVGMIYEGLTRCLPGNEVELALAESVEISNDQKVYTFHLKEAYWTDGEPIRAFDFEHSWKTLLQMPSSCAFLFYPIKNAERFVKGEEPLETVGIRAIDEKTLRIDLQEPTPYFYSLTAFPAFLPVAAHSPDAFSGPFLIEKMVLNDEIVLRKNSAYWNEKNVFLDEVHISIIPDEMTALQMFEKGNLDWMGGSTSPLPPDAMDKLRSRLQFIPCSASTFCTFNTAVCPPNLRKALSYAIDRQTIVEKITQGGQTVANAVLPPSFTSQAFDLYDPELAKKYLEGMALPKLTLYFKQSQMEKRVAQVLQKQWESTLGIEVELVEVEFKTLIQKLQNKDYAIALTSWIAQFDDPMSLLERFKDRANLKNYPGWEDECYSTLLSEASRSKERGKLLQKAEAILIEEMPIAPLYHWSSPVIASPRIEKIASSPCGGILFERFILRGRRHPSFH